MYLWSAFALGFIGSAHCLGMCGPLVLALPQERAGALARAARLLLLYNAGRTLTYIFLGFVFGLIGQALSLAGLQQMLSLTLGSIILLAIIVPALMQRGNVVLALHAFTFLKSAMARLFRRPAPGSLFFIGVLNGLLPCGLVYVALAGSLLTGSALQAASYMAVFGLGTIPALLALGMAGERIRCRWQFRLSRMLPAAAFCLAVLLILRGLSLGIPYISPKLPEHPATATESIHRH